MQWLDFLIIVILCVSLFWGLKTGLVDVVFLCVGLVVGWWLSGRYAANAGELVSFSAGADALVSVLAYVFIMSVSTAIFVMVGRVVKSIANTGTLGAAGLADRLAGVALGLLVGLTVSGALIVILARLAFASTFTGSDIDIPTTGIVAVDTADTASVMEDNRRILVDGLVNSKSVSLFLDVWDTVPEISFGPLVGDFAVGLDMLSREASGNSVA